jgi:hypothetical protein
MPITVYEHALSRESTVSPSSSIDLRYTLSGSEDDAAIRSALDSAAPATYAGLTRESYTATPLGGGVWEGLARYSWVGASSEYSFNTGGGSQRITQSLSTMGAYAPSGLTAPDFQQAIGVTNDSVEGVDIPMPIYQFSETHYFAAALVTGTYKNTLYRMTPRFNNATWTRPSGESYAAGECLFLGARGSKQGDAPWAITFEFASSPNVTGLTVGTITGISKRGWDYLWVRYVDDVDGFTLIKRPAAVYVEQVYYPGDFSTLGIG